MAALRFEQASDTLVWVDRAAGDRWKMAGALTLTRDGSNRWQAGIFRARTIPVNTEDHGPFDTFDEAKAFVTALLALED